MQNKPPIAIIIANFNGSKYILDAVKSALNQTYTPCGVFITDDKSTDNSLEIIRNFCGSGEVIGENEHYLVEIFKDFKSPVFLFSLKKNVGRGLVRNFSIDFALQNNYYLVQILDADDILLPEKCEKLANVIIRDPERIGLAYADYFIMSNNIMKYEAKYAYDYNILRSGNSIIHSGAMINSIALKQHGLYPNLSTCEDYHLFRRLCQNFLAYHVAEPLTVVRSHDEDSSHSIVKEEWEQNFRRVMTET